MMVFLDLDHTRLEPNGLMTQLAMRACHKPLVVGDFLRALNGGRIAALAYEPGCWSRSVQIC
ncbi:hypothetical protein ALP34_200040 [Pseudomonas savastanoi pv. glycinea]|nr:hypothetical protein ALP34_200040 [Pseudomonas savastanoi pv. glycinea]